MKPILTIILALLLSLSLHAQNKNLNPKVVPATVIVEGDSLVSYELRFYKIKSARDSQQMFYDKYGHWDNRLDGRYQSNVPLLVWTEAIVPGIQENLTLAAGGTETMTDYFAFIIALDNKGQDCLRENDPRRDILLSYFSEKMNTLGKANKFWKAYENEGY